MDLRCFAVHGCRLLSDLGILDTFIGAAFIRAEEETALRIPAKEELSVLTFRPTNPHRQPACKVGVGGNRFLNQCSVNRGPCSYSVRCARFRHAERPNEPRGAHRYDGFIDGPLNTAPAGRHVFAQNAARRFAALLCVSPISAATASRLRRSRWFHSACRPHRWSSSCHPSRRSFWLLR